MKRVTGIGGIFFEAENPGEWYEKHLGTVSGPGGAGAMLEIDPMREDHDHGRFAWITDTE